MPSHKAERIDLNSEYPCPCPRRKGRLQPITLTDAMGCDRCQHIFVVEDNGYLLEKLSSSYPYKRSWRWNGQRWNTAYTNFGDSYLTVALGIVFVLLIIWLPLVIGAKTGANVILWAILAVLLSVLPVLMIWLAYRR